MGKLIKMAFWENGKIDKNGILGKWENFIKMAFWENGKIDKNGILGKWEN